VKLAIVGVGLVTPWARSSVEHAFYLRAGVIGPPRSPFVGPDDDPVKVRFCPWLGPRLDLGERAEQLASSVLAEALAPLRARELRPDMVQACLPRARADRIAEPVERALGAVGSSPRIGRVWDQAGVFAALEATARILEDSPRRMVAIVAVDSFVDIEVLTTRVERGPSPWADREPPPSEGAAALLLTSPQHSAAVGLDVLGTVDEVSVFHDRPTDDNDEAVTAAAMSGALRKLPASAPWRHVFGQVLVGGLRRSEWHMATARNARRFGQECEMRSLEGEVGALGAAAGAADLVYGLASLRHDTTGLGAELPEQFLAWSISPDGTRGLAAVTAARG